MNLRDYLSLGLYLMTASCGALPKIPVRYSALAAFYDGAPMSASKEAVFSAPMTHSEAVMEETRFLMEMARRRKAKGAAVSQHEESPSDLPGAGGSVDGLDFEQLPKQALRT
ncbi:hypothetical protein CERZMDRAFT_97886 [Cercospora zeae-maydis SCOH1-5]|uniref:Uncharacterized protein n=1 Tax=Cercospora zeae-maydis SCOH1-5 TaxID=717836 RepID=A0A6A6FFF3_9PEZI|nr:hypothetical protein CERZMDRAFT_97886 [Cercospora zeae-maydis SCOH1-5]